MSRELNADLFPERREVRSTSKASGVVDVQDLKLTIPETARPEEVQLLGGQIEILKKKIKELEARVEMTNSRLTDVVSATKTRFERVTGHGQRLEEAMKASFQDLVAKFSQLASRLNERKVAEAKTQELLDRHHQLVQSFELRLSQMQKVIAEQELQLVASRSELKEAQRELAKLKRL